MHASRSIRPVARLVAMPTHAFDASTFAYMLRVEPQRLIDPFLGIDAFSMPQPYFLPHPHGGMSAITLLFADSPGGVRNRDSTGDDSVIAPGDLHWTQAGSGIIHEETPSHPGQAALGLQIFVDMAPEHKYQDAAVFKVKRADMPVMQDGDVHVTAVAGELPDGSAASPIGADARWSTRVGMWDIRVQPNGTLRLPIPNLHNVFFVLRSGSLVFRTAQGEQVVDQPTAVVWNPVVLPTPVVGDDVVLQAGPDGCHGVMFHGKPIGEPVLQHGPFTGNTRQDIANYMQAFHDGDMGALEPSFVRG
jgi:redox-sensitive bicupin YhaK (pirin superfamily)